MNETRLAVDIGGTFTDLALVSGSHRFTAKVLTTPSAPENGVLKGIDSILAQSGIDAANITALVHGTTLATNAIIERKGAKTAFLVTEGFRDSLDMAFENRFEQYDIMMDRPLPLVPRQLRFPVPERLSVSGDVIIPLDEDAVTAIAKCLRDENVESVAVGYLHSYVDDRHERQTAKILREALPDIRVTLSSEVCSEIREYERWTTACANAYVQPLMASYLERLESQLRLRDMECPIFVITSAGGLTTLETARNFPIRLVESGPAGGAILASRISQECGFDKVVSFDMGGTTAKICLMDHGRPHYSRTFEVARQYRFLKGSGLPIRIPVIEMVEIGAGGGSIASVDDLGRIQVGPESAGSEPGPACYARGGHDATVTDADVVLGRLDSKRFAGGAVMLSPELSVSAVLRCPGNKLGLDAIDAALGISEIVEENMASAARVHAIERGTELEDRTMIAFGGAAPLHAARFAEKLGIRRIVVPTGAGVGSAIGFLMAPVSYEVTRSMHVVLNRMFDPMPLNALRKAMNSEAEMFVRRGDPEGHFVVHWSAEMRYRGQGHDLTVTIPSGDFSYSDAENLTTLFIEKYVRRFGQSIPGLDVEVMNWSLRLSNSEEPPRPCTECPRVMAANPVEHRQMVDPHTGKMISAPVFARLSLGAGDSFVGPAIIVEDETTTIVPAAFDGYVNTLGYIVLERKASQ
jgi:N-methylhydantoinase A